VANNTDQKIFYEVLVGKGQLGTQTKRKCMFADKIEIGDLARFSTAEETGTIYRVSWWFQSHLQPQLVCADVEVHTVKVRVENEFLQSGEDDFTEPAEDAVEDSEYEDTEDNEVSDMDDSGLEDYFD